MPQGKSPHCTLGFRAGLDSLEERTAWCLLGLEPKSRDVRATCVAPVRQKPVDIAPCNRTHLQVSLNNKRIRNHKNSCRLLSAGPSGRSPAEIAGSNPAEGMIICLLCVFLSGGVCDRPITRPECPSVVSKPQK